MALGYLYSNAATTTLAGTLGASDTSGTLALGTGALFASPGAGQFQAGVITDAATQTKHEIVTITNRSGDVVTIARGAEGSTAQTWAVGDLFFNGITLFQMASQLQVSHLVAPQIAQSGSGIQVTQGYSGSETVEIVAPSNGWVVAHSFLNIGAAIPGEVSSTLELSTGPSAGDTTPLSQTHFVTSTASSGATITASNSVSVTTLVGTIGITYGVLLSFTPDQ